jgi:hypothetical protein
MMSSSASHLRVVAPSGREALGILILGTILPL